LFKSEDDIIDFSKTIEDLQWLEDVWPEIAKNVVNYFTEESHKRILRELVKELHINYYKAKENNENARFFWQKACITGSFEKYNREELVAFLEANWWEFVTSVSKNTDFLLAWDKAWSKLKKAQELWVKVMSLEEFFGGI
jgi:DNA ligase (NAD+)